MVSLLRLLIKFIVLMIEMVSVRVSRIEEVWFKMMVFILFIGMYRIF